MMNLSCSIALFATLLFGGGATGPRVVIRTTIGDITVELDETRAPVTTKNFLGIVDSGGYDEATFYRTVTPDNQPNNDVTIEVIQGGLGDRAGDRPPIVHETTKATGIRHRNGVISMARLEPGTASSEFFICIGDQPELDFGGKRNPDGQGFAAFGKVVKGMETVLKIQRQPAAGQMLRTPVRIISISRVH